MRVAVLGAAGTIGPAIARDLAESSEVDDLLLLDRDGDGQRIVAVDAADRRALIAALDGCDVVVNAASYRLNLAVMDACLAARCAYVDLGGLYHVSAQQLALDEAFAAAGLLAVLGCGAAPGKTNVMAVAAAAALDTVEAVRCASGGVDLDPPEGFWTPYAVQTLIDEVTLDPIVVRDGKATPIAPLTDGGTITFPDPVGARESIYTLHSEVLTLPASLGAAACDFRLCLAPAVREHLVAGTTEDRAGPSAQTWSAQRVDVTGTRDGHAKTVTATALTRPHERWGIGGGIVSTAAVAAATARLYARGVLSATGVHPPEHVLPAELLFAELETRGCRFELSA
jgi:lysine 6-dehydrogenase